jgi:L-fucose mutarotase
MLIGIHPWLNGPLLASLRDMGHGDEVAIVDANFPAASLARRLHRLDAANSAQALRMLLSVLPLDDFGDTCAWRMEVVDQPSTDLPIFADFRAALREAYPRPTDLASLERQAFYERARAAFAVIVTSEQRLYGNVLLRKGVIRPESAA